MGVSIDAFLFSINDSTLEKIGFELFILTSLLIHYTYTYIHTRRKGPNIVKAWTKAQRRWGLSSMHQAQPLAHLYQASEEEHPIPLATHITWGILFLKPVDQSLAEVGGVAKTQSSTNKQT